MPASNHINLANLIRVIAELSNHFFDTCRALTLDYLFVERSLRTSILSLPLAVNASPHSSELPFNMASDRTESVINGMSAIRTSRGGKKSTRSRSGCRICKIPRVKCDEGHPVCQRCSSTGRACDGYGVWDSKYPLPSTTRSPSLDMTVSCSVSRNRNTQSYFDWFVTRARKKIPGIFASDFWNTLVLQVSTQEKAVLYSLVALTSAHKSGMLSPAGIPENENFTLQHYNAAIFHLQHHLASGSKESIRIVAISCLIFICLEFMRGNIKTSADHLQNGLNLLPLLNSQPYMENGALVLKAQNESIEDAVTEAFLRLYVYSARFHRFARNYSIVTQDHALSGQSRSFPTVAVARQHLEMNCSIAYTCLKQMLASYRLFLIQSRLQCCKSSDGSRDLDCWLSLLNNSYADSANSDSESLPLTLLRIHHNMAYVMAGTCLAPRDELAYDLFKSSFDSIVSLSNHILEAAASVMAADIICGACTEKFSFSADMGIILPLYYTILKCR
ncbi:transcriptional regulatory moc3 [Fusarium phyllophilum]|uniref:Transcriptional regulatory moc3 n=1 Tax=Fusarium phyllophilum TaxID=47803 RepID=A0A8H5JYD7_9HYPO|nr:transcriptional regulatory moc3 [Fusarium phyllophilum]